MGFEQFVGHDDVGDAVVFDAPSLHRVVPAFAFAAPGDLWATVFRLPDYAPDAKWCEQTGLEPPLSRGQVIREIPT